MPTQKPPNKKEIKNSLLDQLAAKGADIELFTDRVESYLKLWSLAKKLNTDISKRGHGYYETASNGAKVWKANPSVKDLVSVDRQMTTILREMGLNVNNVGIGDDEPL